MSNVESGRFSASQCCENTVREILGNRNIVGVMSVVKFKDGSYDFYVDGNILTTDIAYASKIMEATEVNPTIQSELD